jgi:sugar phosphate isomerase/epimerase
MVGYRDYLAALKSTGYKGFLTIEMHAGAEGRPDDIIKAKENLIEICNDLQINLN